MEGQLLKGYRGSLHWMKSLKKSFQLYFTQKIILLSIHKSTLLLNYRTIPFAAYRCIHSAEL